MTDWIGATFTSDRGWGLLERLTDIGDRMAGSDGERRGLEATREALAAAGARDARIEPFPIQGWERGGSRIEAGGETATADYRCLALPRSPAGSATGELVDLGHGLPGDFQADLDGAVALVDSDVPEGYDRFIHRREKYYRAAEAGADAFLFRNHLDGCLPPTGSVGTAGNPVGAIPALGVSKEYGARLARRAAGGEVTVTVDCSTPGAESGTVYADLGPDTDERLLLTSHVDAHDIAEGAMDNGAGTATVVEVAAALARREDELDRRVTLACFGAEEVGLLGSTRAADRADTGAIRAVVNVDATVSARTLSVYPNGFDELRDAAERVGRRLDHPVDLKRSPNVYSDHWPFVERGVPGYMITAESGRDRGWGHTHADTLDKLDVRTLREQAVLLTELVVELAGDGVRVDPADDAGIATMLADAGLAEGMRLTGDWPP